MFITLQYLLPKQLLSRLGGYLANCKITWVKNSLIHAALKHYTIDMKTAKQKDPFSYPSFNAFFTRELAKQAAEYFPEPPQWGAPAEGILSQFGQTDAGHLIQAKGKKYSVQSLLSDHPCAKSLQEGSFATIYLAPHNYHRVHSPIAGTITEIQFIPGKLFSVNLKTAAGIDGLFAQNERMVFYITSTQGCLAFVMVGALMVSGIRTRFPQGSGLSIPIQIGDELGYFDFGSTVVLVSEKPLQFNLIEGSPTTLGLPFASSLTSR
ncbi:MAG: archaetidylserine decarboxylase [Gammaproteobacteria bacterium]|jgi:phosphatidylserine decarboxylase|nr:archaetidylserine decarboxylase [Gammaproteobacteria bacterium]